MPAAVSLVFLSANACTVEDTLGVQEVYDRHALARGGKTALEAIESVELELRITEPEFEVSGIYRASRNGNVRIDIFDNGERVFTEAIGPDGAWQMNSQGEVSEVSQPGIDALRRGLVGNLIALHERQKFGYVHELEVLLGQDGDERIALKEITDTGFVQTYFLDPESYLILSSRESSALHPDLDDTVSAQETFYTSYEKNGNVEFPGHSEKIELATGKTIQEVRINRRVINPVFEAQLFQRPERQGVRP